MLVTGMAASSAPMPPDRMATRAESRKVTVEPASAFVRLGQVEVLVPRGVR